MRFPAIALLLFALGLPAFLHAQSTPSPTGRTSYGRHVRRVPTSSQRRAEAVAKTKAQQAIWHAQSPTQRDSAPRYSAASRSRSRSSTRRRTQQVQYETLPEGAVPMEPMPYDGPVNRIPASGDWSGTVVQGPHGEGFIPGEFEPNGMGGYSSGPYEVGPYDEGPFEMGPYDVGPYDMGMEPYGCPSCMGDGCMGCEMCMGDPCMGCDVCMGEGCDLCMGGCGDPYCEGCQQCGPCDGGCPPSGDLSFELGVQGFTGPTNLGSAGSFGFQQSINYGRGLPLFRCGIGWQIGFRTVQSNLSGSRLTGDRRNQTFFTTGLFRRARTRGWQWGLVVDLVSDDWYDKTTIRQLRGEIGRRLSEKRDWGYWFAFGGDEDTTLQPVNGETTVDFWEPLNLNALYYRSQIGRICGSQVRCYAGFSGRSDGLLGVDTQLPLGRRWGLRSTATYLIPDQDRSEDGYVNEAWNVGIALTWNFRGRNLPGRYAPLINVADNGSFIVERVNAN